jgi:hypothetical protein
MECNAPHLNDHGLYAFNCTNYNNELWCKTLPPQLPGGFISVSDIGFHECVASTSALRSIANEAVLCAVKAGLVNTGLGVMALIWIGVAAGLRNEDIFDEQFDATLFMLLVALGQTIIAGGRGVYNSWS